MTRQELLDKQTLVPQDAFEYFGLKDIQSLENYIASLTYKNIYDLDIDDVTIYNSFRFVTKSLKDENLNPIRENLILYSMVLTTLYGFDTDDFVIVSRSIGAFKFLRMLEIIFQDNDIYKYYTKLYQSYKNDLYNLSQSLRDVSSQVMEMIDKYLGNLKTEDLDVYVKKAQEFFEKLSE